MAIQILFAPVLLGQTSVNNIAAAKNTGEYAAKGDLDPIPFECRPSFFQTVGSNSILVRYDATNVTIGFDTLAIFGFQVNATAYNPVDNYLYTISSANSHLIRVHGDGSFIDLGALNIPTGIIVGDFTATGQYYAKRGGGVAIHIIDVNTLNVTNIQSNGVFVPVDWAYNVYKNKFYGAAQDRVYSFDPATLAVSFAAVTGLVPGGYGAAFITEGGEVYVSNNSSGLIFHIDLNTNIATVVVQGPANLSINDGASCPSAPNPFVAYIFSENDTTCISLDGAASVNILANDEGYLTSVDSASFSVVTAPAFGDITYDYLSGTVDYTASGTPQADFFEYSICGNNPDFPACDTSAVFFLPPITSNMAVSICAGDYYNFGGIDYFQEGTYSHLFSSSDGCDSLVFLDLELMLPEINELEAVICADDSYLFMGNTYTASGLYPHIGVGANGCTSITTLRLTVNPPIANHVEAAICAGESYGIGNSVYTQTGSYTKVFTANNGCDSIVALDLTVLPLNVAALEATICAGESYSVGSSVYTQSGFYTDVLTATNNCDSIVTLDLTVLPLPTTTLEATICAGESYSVGSSVYSQSGNYTDILTATNNCDSIITLELTVFPLPGTTLDATICAGESYSVGSSVYTQTGSYTDVLTAANSCDSIVTLDLTVLPLPSTTLEATICAGESFSVGSSVYAQTGSYTDVLTAANNCDSIVTLDLTVLPLPATALEVSICAGESFSVGSSVYTQTGSYTDVLTATNSCDSIITLDLTVLPLSATTLEATICAGESFSVGSSVYTQSGNYTDVLTATNSCDSIITLKLTVFQKDTTLIEQMTCSPEEVGLEILHFSNQNACDSTVLIYTSLAPENDCMVAGAVSGSVLFCDQLSSSITGTIHIGTAPFTLSWTGPESGMLSLNNLNEAFEIPNLPPGNYSITILDANLHSSSLQASVTESSPPDITASTTSYLDYEISCTGADDGSASVVASGGSPPYAYAWTTGESSADIVNLPPGTYTVTVTDAHHCAVETAVQISEPEPLDMSFEITELRCFENYSGAIEALVDGGQAPYSYAINDGPEQEGSLFQNLSSGTYSVLVTDAVGCTAAEIIWINTPLQVEVTLGDNIIIDLGDQSTLTALVNMPMSALDTVLWNALGASDCPGCLQQTVMPLITTTYMVNITAANGCAAADEVTVLVKRPNIYAPNVFSPNGDGINDVFLLFTGNPGIVKIKEISVFDRWGDLLYTRSDILPNDHSVGWDGTFRGREMNPGVFVWFAFVELIDGYGFFLEGDVSLVR